MRISANYSQYNIPVYKTRNSVQFKANYGVVTDAKGRLLYRNTSSFFRGDMNWQQAAEKLKDIRHLYIYGCSSGEEALTMAISAIRRYGEKFFENHPPIFARDIDEECIINANKGIYYIDEREKSLIESALADIMPQEYYERMKSCFNGHMARKINDAATAQKNIDKYVRITEALPVELSASGLPQSNNKYRLEVLPSLKENIIFSRGDIFEDIEKLPDSRVMLGSRNFWPYIENTRQMSLLRRISHKYKGTNSYIMFGDYDNPYDYSTMYPMYNGKFTDKGSYVKKGLDEYGYKETDVDNIFEI